MSPLLAAVRNAVIYPRSHVRGRIVLPFAILTILLAGAGSYFVTTVLAGSLQERFDNQLVQTGRSVADELVHIERRQLEDVRGMAATQGVGAALSDEDAARTRTLLEPLVRNQNMHWVAAVDSDGSVLFGTARSEDGTYAPVLTANLADWWPVRKALEGPDERGDKYASLVETEQGFVLLTAAPVYEGDRIVGAVTSGVSVQPLVDMLKKQSLGDVTIYDYAGRSIASTLARDEEDRASLQVSGASLAGILETPDATERASIEHSGRVYDLAYGLLVVRGNVIGVYSVALSSDYIAVAGRNTRIELAVFVTIAVAAVLAIGLIVSKRITDPILKLAHAASQLSAGDLSARSAVRSDDEIGVLASTFDEMAVSLEDYAARLSRQYIGTIKALTSAIDARDPYTLGHSLRVGQLGMLLGAELGLADAVLHDVEVGGYLHDIGKIGVRDVVLLKTGTLTAEEREAIQRHPEIGTSILRSVELAPDVLAVVRGHHERLDGSGYPDRLRGDEISIVQRIAAVADMYDALMTARPYKEAMEVSDVMDILRRESGVLLDERVVDALIRIAPAWEERVHNDASLQGSDIGVPIMPRVRRSA